MLQTLLHDIETKKPKLEGVVSTAELLHTVSTDEGERTAAKLRGKTNFCFTLPVLSQTFWTQIWS